MALRQRLFWAPSFEGGSGACFRQVSNLCNSPVIIANPAPILTIHIVEYVTLIYL